MPAMQTAQAVPAKAYLALAAGLLILGFSAILVRTAEAPGVVVGFYRVGIGALVLAFPFAKRLRAGPHISRQALLLTALAGLLFGADLAAWTSGIVISGATIPTLFANTAPLWVGLGAWLLLKERLSVQFWLGLLLALVGVVLILGLKVGQNFALDQGAMLGLLAGIYYGAYFLATQRGRMHLDVTSFFWLTALFSTITLLAVTLFLGHPLLGYSQATYINFIIQGVVIQAGGWMLINYAQGFLPASVIAPTLLGQPVLTAVLAGPLLGESLRAVDILGGATVLIGILLVHHGRRPRRPLPMP